MPSNFIKSVYNYADLPNDKISEICFIGRSNVGKSTLINSLLKFKDAFVSKTPGRTQCINLYTHRNVRLVDLPGYGFARINKEKTTAMHELINKFFFERKNIRHIYLIVDIGVIMGQDKEIYDYLLTTNKKVTILFNKIDKFSNNKINSQLSQAEKFFGTNKDNYKIISGKKSINIKNIT
jgi:GTP-binding protein